MLKGIPAVLSPDLLKILAEMGHGDEIVFADCNFPAASNAERLIRCDGLGIAELLKAVLKVFPLDSYVDNPVALMEVVHGDKAKPTIWNEYRKIIKASGEKFKDFELIERFDFYERTKEAYVVVATTETSPYANIILKKGCIRL
ncbi:MAG: L-fucose mutarotase [Phycisphaerales bacterium]